MSEVVSGSIEVRAVEAGDRDAVIGLLSASLGWVPDELSGQYFAWKHEHNTFGPSPAWVAVSGTQLVGFRTFLRWQLEGPGDVRLSAVRAVDTATHPDYSGRGIFRRLTMHALDAVRAEGVDLVFNTPNSQSRPGYLKMGWTDAGRLRAAVRPRGPGALVRMMRARVPAERWSTATDAGTAAAELLAPRALDSLIDELAAPTTLRTHRTAAHLRWRYGFEPLSYRGVALGGDVAEGLAVFRVRRRGAATEAALCELLAPGGDRSVERTLEREVLRCSGADYVIRLGGPIVDTAGFVRLPGQGPRLTLRGVAADAPPPDLAPAFSLGDIELL